MMTAALVKRHICCISEDRPFSTREFLGYGPRAAIDQALYRLVQKGKIIRIARGLFIKEGATMPSVKEVAKAKAEAFGRTIAEYGETAMRMLGLKTEKEINEGGKKTKEQEAEKPEAIYACNGRTSSFKFGDIVIKLVGVSPRKMNLGDDRVGLVLRALWHCGKEKCDSVIASLASRTLNREERQVLRQVMCFMPYWMPQCFVVFRRPYQFKPVFKSASDNALFKAGNGCNMNWY